MDRQRDRGVVGRRPPISPARLALAAAAAGAGVCAGWLASSRSPAGGLAALAAAGLLVAVMNGYAKSYSP